MNALARRHLGPRRLRTLDADGAAYIGTIWRRGAWRRWPGVWSTVYTRGEGADDEVDLEVVALGVLDFNLCEFGG